MCDECMGTCGGGEPKVGKPRVFTIVVHDASFEEGKHPRADDGKWTAGSGGGGSSGSSKPAGGASKPAGGKTDNGPVSLGGAGSQTNAGAKNWALGFQQKYPSMADAKAAIAKVSDESVKKGHAALKGFEDPLSNHIRGMVEAEAKKRGLSLGASKVESDLAGIKADMSALKSKLGRIDAEIARNPPTDGRNIQEMLDRIAAKYGKRVV